MSDKFDVLLDLARYNLQANPEWRFGQACFNSLALMEPETAHLITSTDKDPFYRNENLPAFLEALKVYWEMKERVS